MTLEEQIRETVQSAVREAIRLEIPLAIQAAPATSEGVSGTPLDYDALRERGYSEREARAMLRAWGVKVPGGRRARIPLGVLRTIEKGDNVD